MVDSAITCFCLKILLFKFKFMFWLYILWMKFTCGFLVFFVLITFAPENELYDFCYFLKLILWNNLCHKLSFKSLVELTYKIVAVALGTLFKSLQPPQMTPTNGTWTNQQLPASLCLRAFHNQRNRFNMKER